MLSTLVCAIIRRFGRRMGVLFMDVFAEIRRRHLVGKENISLSRVI